MKNTVTPSRFLVVGSGLIGLRHCETVRNLCEGADVRRLILRNLPESPVGGFPVIYDMKSAIEFKPDVVVVANATSSHLATAKNFINIGRILLIEKPISNDFDEIQAFVKTYTNTSNEISIGYNLRFSKSLMKFRELIHSGLIGEILSVRCQVGKYLPDWRPNRDYTTSVSARKELGGGVLLELSHEIDYLRWIFGEFMWVEAVISRQSDLRIDVEDLAHLTFAFERSHLMASTIGTLSMDFFRPDSSRNCTVIGSSGTLYWDGLHGEIRVYKKEAQLWETIFCDPGDVNQSYEEMWRELLSLPSNKESAIASMNDGLKVVELISAARKSSEFHRRVNLDTGKLPYSC